MFTSTSSKGHDLWFLIAGFQPVLSFSMFQGSFLVSIIMIDSRKRNCKLTFKVQSSCVNEKCSQLYNITS